MTCISSTISTRKGIILKKSIEEYIRAHPKIVSFVFGKKRLIFLGKYIECTENRKDRNRRMQFFTAGIELLKSKNISSYEKIIEKQKYIECTSETADGFLFAVHIREEIENGDRRLYLISTFERNK